MPADAALSYTAAVDAVEEQRRRLGLVTDTDRWSAAGQRFSADPRREAEPNLRAILEYVRAGHVVLDVGGGAGRYTLPIALRCREAVNIEPSAGMGAAFEASRATAGITNAHLVAADWLAAKDVEGDVSLVAHVTYFVRDIVPFLEKLVAASRERVIIAIAATPPPNQGARLFELVNGEPQALVPGYRELLPVLWDMGILPDLRVLGEAEVTMRARVFSSREEAIAASLTAPGMSEAQRARTTAVLESRFDELFVPVEGGFRSRGGGDLRMLLITWRTHDTWRG